MALDIPRVIARWVTAKHFHGNESLGIPIKHDIQENHMTTIAWATSYYNNLNAEYATKQADEKVDCPAHEGTYLLAEK